MADQIQEVDFYTEEECTGSVTVLNFSTYDVGQCDIFSMNYTFLDQTLFSFRIYPNGNCAMNDGYVSVDLLVRPLDPYKLSLQCVLSLLDVDGNQRYFQSFSNETVDGTLGLHRFVNRERIMTDSEFVRKDSLTICYNLKYVIFKNEIQFPRPSKKATKIKIHVKEASKEEQVELITQDDKTLTLMMRIDDIDAILSNKLCKRSQVFARMFTTEMFEKRNKRVFIPDMDYATLNHLISYTNGESKALHTVQEIADLYRADDKYAILDLKLECGVDLIKNTCVENVTRILSLAQLYQDKRLKMWSMAFVQNYYDEIIVTDEWKSLQLTQPELAEEAKTFDVSEIVEKIQNFRKGQFVFPTDRKEIADMYL
ncbi:TD and POZ domain-containing protein 4 [Parasteatoda tepidariorum]|uniref:TD and POZ domain-containing protein 4 n=1 Tax=Parasteatoda tepidariorum TaxID=114398 RepID=UPI001C71851F|nr:uncharacterized protein LOC122270845 [Parasteatoda tepidariorum]